jgi:hypothetical protein
LQYCDVKLELSASPNGQEGGVGLPYLHLETENIANDEIVGMSGRFSVLKLLCRIAGMLQLLIVPACLMEERTFDHTDMLQQIITGLCKRIRPFL